MKTPLLAHARLSVTSRSWCGALILAAFGSAQAAEPTAAAKASEEKKAEAEISDFKNWLEFSAGGVFLNGDSAQFQRRSGLPSDGFGGIESFHWERDVGKKGIFLIDGRAIFDNHDYSLKLELSDPDKGYFRAGYKEYRTWYDGSGGYFPPNKRWFTPKDEDPAIDRGEFFVQLGLTLPQRPQISLEYRHQFRDGSKNSLSWADSTQAGQPTATNLRNIVPSFLQIDEQRDIFAADVTHTLGNTDFGLGVRYERADNDNSRNIHRRPGETTDRYVTQREGLSSDMFNAHAFTETRWNDKISFTSGYSVTTMDSDVTGSRIYGAGYDPVYDPVFARRQARDEGFIDLVGGSEMKQYVLNFNLRLAPVPNFTLVPSLRIERQDLDGISEDVGTSFGTTAGFPATREEIAAENERNLLDLSEAVEARYTGFSNWVWYSRLNFHQGEGDLSESQLNLETKLPVVIRKSDFDRSSQQYTVGANWYPSRQVNLAGQYYRKIRDDNFVHDFDSTTNTTGNRYPAFLIGNNFITDDLNFRVTWRPSSQLTSVTRYDYQRSTIEMQGDKLKNVESANLTSHILSESITWAPVPRLYLQGSINLVWDRTATPADSLTKAVLDFQNDYWNASLLAGCVLDDKTDFQVQYSYYRADNFTDNSAFGQPYGADAREYAVTASLSRQIRQNLHWNLKYSFYSNHDRTSGGHDDYEAHLVSSSVRWYFRRARRVAKPPSEQRAAFPVPEGQSEIARRFNAGFKVRVG